MKLTGIKLMLLSIVFYGCAAGPQPVLLGKENCEQCKMTIMENQFVAELVTKKTKLYKFDDVQCLLNFVQADKIKKDEIKNVYLMDYEAPGNFISASNAFFIKSENLKSPMGGNIAAFKTEAAATKYVSNNPGQKINWNQLLL